MMPPPEGEPGEGETLLGTTDDMMRLGRLLLITRTAAFDKGFTAAQWSAALIATVAADAHLHSRDDADVLGDLTVALRAIRTFDARHRAH